MLIVIVFLILIIFIYLALRYFKRPEDPRDPRERMANLLRAGDARGALTREIRKSDTETICLILAQESQYIPLEQWRKIRKYLMDEGRNGEFIDLLGHEDPELRGCAAEALGYLNFPGSSQALLTALGDRRGEVQLAASRSLAKIKDLSLLDPLVDLLGKGGSWLPARVADVLAAMGGEAVPPLLAALGGLQGPPLVHAVEILGELRAPGAVPVLQDIAVGSPQVEARAAAAQALGVIGDPGAVSTLMKTLDDEAWEVRLRGAKALGRIGDDRCEAVLRGALEDEEWNVRVTAEAALKDIAAAKE